MQAKRRPHPIPLHRAAAAIALLLAGGPAAAELPFGFIHHGNFRRIHHTGDASGQVALASLPRAPGAWGLGALAGLRGEILQLDGRLLVSTGGAPDGRLDPPAADAEAALFAGARVAAWRDVVMPRDLDRGAFEALVQEQARLHGLALDQPFLFRVEGLFRQLAWHVVAGLPAGQARAGGHGAPHAEMNRFRQDQARGQLVAIYTGVALEGVLSHPGERFHLHFVDAAVESGGHVDHYAVAAGSILKLPVR